jgi:hypothetical protein
MSESNTRVIIMGGLGNQLFQYSFALARVAGSSTKIILDPNFASIRVNSEGKPDLSSYKLNETVKVEEVSKYPKILRKVTGLGIRLNLENRNFSTGLKGKALQFLADLIHSLYFRHRCILYFSDDNGFSELDSRRNFTTYIGYFQSYIFADEVKAKLHQLMPIEKSEQLTHFQERAKSDTPLIVHIRLKDYRNEAKFGILSHEYYLEAITRQVAMNCYKRIWLFSDEPLEAMDYIPSKFHDITENVSEKISGTVDTLEIMRLGAGYVLANSTYSWWAAYLSHTKDPFVIYPTPWFSGMPEPSHLTPGGWLPINR